MIKIYLAFFFYRLRLNKPLLFQIGFLQNSSFLNYTHRNAMIPISLTLFSLSIILAWIVFILIDNYWIMTCQNYSTQVSQTSFSFGKIWITIKFEMETYICSKSERLWICGLFVLWSLVYVYLRRLFLNFQDLHESIFK